MPSSDTIVVPGTLVCKRYDNKWYEGSVTSVPNKATTNSSSSSSCNNNNDNSTNSNSNASRYIVMFEDDEEDSLSHDEIQVGLLAHSIINNNNNKSRRNSNSNRTTTIVEQQQQQPQYRPAIGTKIKKHFVEGWFYGAVIDQTPHKSMILYREDGEEEYMSDIELKVTAATYDAEVEEEKRT